MLIKEVRPGIYDLTLSGYELSTLVSAARWIQDGAKGRIS